MRFGIIIGLVVVCLTLLVAAPSAATFRQDPGDGCLGPEDPFCGGGDGSGGSSGACFHCATRNVNQYITSAICCTGSCIFQRLAGYRISGDGASCDVRANNGLSYCELGGSCSSGLTLTPDTNF
jgi:hypothetical protein